jgi:dihydropteroate synthase
MAIINATPDSFSQDGCYVNAFDTAKAIEYCHRQSENGADILDIGGESTRPGADQIPADEEKRRVIPLIDGLAKNFKKPISIDTYKPEVAKAALDAGASIVNNIMGSDPDEGLLKMIGNYQAAVVLMHMRGLPRTMQENIHYDDLIGEISLKLSNSIKKCLESGIQSDKIIVDPGIGFGKTVEHNCRIIRRLGDFHALGQPILIGTSRKSFIGKILEKNVDDRLVGTMATVVASILNGAHIVRVHDAREARDAVLMTDAIINSHNESC